MSENDFLKNLKNAVDEGEFNSDAARKINEISELADIKSKSGKIEDIDKSVKERLENSGLKSVSEEEAMRINKEYEKKIQEIDKVDKINGAIRTLVDIEDAVMATINDLVEYVESIKSEYSDELDKPIFEGLKRKIDELDEKFSVFLNNKQ